MDANLKFKSVDAYISQFSGHTKQMLEQMRAIIQKTAPKAEEVISYNMPTYKQQGMLISFAGYKNHIGLYPGSAGVAQFKEETKGYVTSKGTIQFPLDKKLPVRLITSIVQFRVRQNAEKAALKSKKKK